MTMNHKIFTLGLALMVSLIPGRQYFSEGVLHEATGNNLYAQGNKYSYKQYDDRKEGIIRSSQLVAGERLVLVAAAIANNEPLPQNSGSQYHLGFYLKDSAQLNIEVWEFEKRYKMEPLENDWKSGLQQFAWSAEIPRYYDIGLEDLFPLAKISGSRTTKIVPVVLYHVKPQFSEVSYNFYLVAQDEISVLAYKIYDTQTETPRLVYSDTLRDLRAHERISVRWRGKGRNNLAVRSGWYTLFLEASFKARPPVVSEYQFYHHAGLLQEERFSKR
jgi:hypothetical protein